VTRARWYHLVTFLVATAAVVLQFVLVWQGGRVLDETARPDLGTRLIRFASYLTIWGNVLVAWSAAVLATGRAPDTRWSRALRLDAVVLIAVIAVVHFFFLRPLLDLDGADYLADKLLHMVVPLVALVGWVLFGPRGQADWSDLGRFLVVPIGWLGYTLVRGEIVEWYPYPFIDVNEHGYGPVLLACLGVAALAILVLAAVIRLDRALGRRT
jgi:hypothetical protein